MMVIVPVYSKYLSKCEFTVAVLYIAVQSNLMVHFLSTNERRKIDITVALAGTISPRPSPLFSITLITQTVVATLGTRSTKPTNVQRKILIHDVHTRAAGVFELRAERLATSHALTIMPFFFVISTTRSYLHKST